MTFTRAIVRHPAANFAAGLSSAGAKPPDIGLAMQQHAQYVRALRDCGIRVTCLDADSDYPDGTFVEDTAILAARGAIVTRPGAASRAGEVGSIAACLKDFYPDLLAIAAPGTVDGGDICEADGHYLIGISARTNAHGARQMAEHLGVLTYTSSILDIRPNPALLHLKSGVAYIGDGLWAVQSGLDTLMRSQSAIDVRDLIVVPQDEAYAANCVLVNGTVLVAAGYPRMSAELTDRGRCVVHLEMSEFKKMDGGLSCLSLRF